MAKKTYILVQLIPEDEPNTGTKYIVTKSTKGPKQGNKLRLRKYDPKTRSHRWFVEKKMPRHSK